MLKNLQIEKKEIKKFALVITSNRHFMTHEIHCLLNSSDIFDITVL